LSLVDVPVNNSYQQGELQRCNSGSILRLSLRKASQAGSSAAPRETGVCPCGRGGRDARGVGDGAEGDDLAKKARRTQG
jgi:hypothetical protein